MRVIKFITILFFYHPPSVTVFIWTDTCYVACRNVGELPNHKSCIYHVNISMSHHVHWIARTEV